MKNSIEEDITKINTYIELILEKDYCNCNELNTILGKHCDGSKNVAYAMQHILSDYKRVLKENEIYKKNSEIMSKENLSTAEQLKVEIKENFRLKNQLENNRKEYQETYKDVREELKELKKENEILKKEKEQAWEEWNNLEQGNYETEQKLKQQIKELKKENEELNNRCRNLDKEAQAYLEELAGDNTLTRRTIKQLQEENEECKLDVQDYLKQAQENAEMYRKAQKKIQDLKAENKELKNDYENLSNSVVVKNYYIENSIPIQKVKDKIEELDKKVKDYQCVENRINLYQRKVLQELLEESEE